ncbi:hypothetical protein AAF712_011997 [Marasmius tenuissimus]|uniref:PHD-type domain-containing protein n=1 Tax=Marasmius tenuissimus TaxID=585030 RepID=A0ABR2ZIY0_9AGAR
MPSSQSQSPPTTSRIHHTERLGRAHTPPPQSHSQTPSQLSSPFMARALLPSTSTPTKGPQPGPVFVDDLFAPHATKPPPQAHGGELERIRQRQIAEHAAVEARRPEYFVREGLGKRKAVEGFGSGGGVSEDLRSSSTSHHPTPKPHPSGVGIMDSPTKGRRIKLYSSSSTNPPPPPPDNKIKLFPDMKLFQETSEESFEESLMAGGYGRYRTAEWVRQPQPIPIEVLQRGGGGGGSSAAPVAASPVVKRLEDQSVLAIDGRREEEISVEEETPQPSEKEMRKRKRLDAFRVLTTSNSNAPSSPVVTGTGTVTVNDSDTDFVNKNNHHHNQHHGNNNNSTTQRKESPRKLYPVELEGRGRVLVDVLPGSVPSGASVGVGVEDVFVQDPGGGGGGGGSKRKKRAIAMDKRGEREISPEYPYGHVVSSASASPSKKRGPISTLPGSVVEEKPNWVDTEFPWRLREEEREEEKVREEEERLRWVERFLEREDDEEDEESDSTEGKGKEKEKAAVEDDEYEISQWGVMYRGDRPKAGRGKMVPLKAGAGAGVEGGKIIDQDMGKPLPTTTTTTTRRKRGPMYFPSDPADARAALLSKRTVRALAMKKQLEVDGRRKALFQEANGRDAFEEVEEEAEEEVLCICDGEGANFEDDDARGVVQCDGCDQWFHFGCMGLRSDQVADNEKWYCQTCEPLRHDHLPEPEPVFVPTDVRAIQRGTGDDPMLYNSQLARESPEPEDGRGGGAGLHSIPRGTPRTPTRRRSRVPGSDYLDGDYPSSPSTRYSYAQPSSSHSTYLTSGSTRGYPTTPRHRLSRTEPRIHGHDAFLGVGVHPDYEESPIFDPTSTPSRGIKFNTTAPFTTPTRKPGILLNGRGFGFSTPSRKSIGGFGGPGFLASALDSEKGGGDSWFGYGGGDESPIRRKKSSGAAVTDAVVKSKRVLDGLLASAASAAGGAGRLDDGFDDSSLGRSPMNRS